MMKPSSFKTWAMRCFATVYGISTAGDSMRLALRIRVSMSAIGSVIMAVSLLDFTLRALPTRFSHAADQTARRHVAEANAANAELAIHRPRPAAQTAAHADLDLVPRPHLDLGRIFLVSLQLLELAVKLNVFRVGGHSRSLGVVAAKTLWTP